MRFQGTYMHRAHKVAMWRVGSSRRLWEWPVTCYYQASPQLMTQQYQADWRNLSQMRTAASQCLPCPNPAMNIFVHISCIRSAFWGKADSHWFMSDSGENLSISLSIRSCSRPMTAV